MSDADGGRVWFTSSHSTVREESASSAHCPMTAP